MTEPQRITLAEVKTNSQIAFMAGKLTAQSSNPRQRLCAYEAGDCRCAIGHSFSEATMELIRHHDLNEGTGIASLAQRGIIAVDEVDLNEIERIQIAHDNWAGAARDNGIYKSSSIMHTDDAVVAFHKSNFLQMIGA